MTLMNIAMTTLLNGICLGVILAAAMMLLLKFFPRLNSTTRFTVLWMTLLAVVALLATPLTPRPSSPDSRIESLVVVSPSPVVIPAPAPAQVYRPGRKTHASHVNSVAAQRPRLETLLPQNRLQSFFARGIAIRTRSDSHSLGKVSSCASNYVGDVLLRAACPVGRGYCVLRSLKSSATPASPDWQLCFSRLCATHDIRRQPQLLVSSHVSGPMSLGFFCPTIVIPRTLLETLSHPNWSRLSCTNSPTCIAATTGATWLKN